MDVLYATRARSPAPSAARRSKPSSRSQLYLDTSSKRRSSKKLLYIDVNAARYSNKPSWPSPAASSALQPPPSFANFAPLRRELWQDRELSCQETTPTAHNFPLVRLAHKRKSKARPSPQLPGQSFRRDLSYTLVSAYDAAAAPFRPKQRRQSRHVVTSRRNTRMSVQGQPQRLSVLRTELDNQTTRTVITGPMSSPAESEHPTSGKKPSRQRSIKSTLTSPLSLYHHSMPFRKSNESASRSRASDPPALPRRSAARSRDSFNRAKIHVRRPPKGCSHWFDALDDSSDDDYPEVVETPQPMSAPAGVTTFQPSLGPHRARAAPTSFVSGSSDGVADYFSYIRANRRRKNSSVDPDTQNSLRFISEDPHDRSVLDLSSDDEGTEAQPSPAGWPGLLTPSPGPHNQTFLRRATVQRKGSAVAYSPMTPALRQSMASMQTTLTSGTIPFMMRISPSIGTDAPPVPSLSSPPHSTSLTRHAASYLALTGRPLTADSSVYPRSPILARSPNLTRSPSIKQSERLLSSHPILLDPLQQTPGSHYPSGAAHFVAVTLEEMELLEIMRSKRAAANDHHYTFDNHTTEYLPIAEEDEEAALTPAPRTPATDRQSGASLVDDAKRSQSLGSTVTLETGENITFPTPPLPTARLSPRLSGSQRGRVGSASLRFGNLPTPLTAASYWSPERPTSSEEIPELEATTYTGHLPIRTDVHHKSIACTINDKRASERYSILRPRVFAGPFQPSITEPEPTFPDRQVPQYSLRDAALNSHPYTAPIPTARRTRTYDAADTFKLMPDLGIDFSDFALPSLSSTTSEPEPKSSSSSPSSLPKLTPNIFSPTSIYSSSSTPQHGRFVTPTTTTTTDTTRSRRSSSLASRAPSLSDVASLSGGSRSELDTPIKESASSGVDIVALPDTPSAHDRQLSELEKLADDHDHGHHHHHHHHHHHGLIKPPPDFGSNVPVARNQAEEYAREYRKLSRWGLDGGADESRRESEGGSEARRKRRGLGNRKASLEVLHAWKGLGGYDMGLEQ